MKKIINIPNFLKKKYFKIFIAADNLNVMVYSKGLFSTLNYAKMN